MKQDLKQLVDSHGKKTVRRKLVDSIKDGEIEPDDVSIRAIWEAFVGPVGQTLDYAQGGSGMIEMADAAVDSSAFAEITGQVLTSAVMEGYNRPNFVGDSLFRVRSSNRKTERTPGFILQDNTSEVEEAMPYPEAGMRDKYVSFESGKKRGVILSITEETIFLDETGALVDRARDIGDFVRKDRETRMLDVFTGTTNNYYPNGSQTNIYSSGNNNLVESNGLTDWTNIEACLSAITDQVDDNGNKIVLSVDNIILPWALVATASHILNATSVQERTNSGNRVTEGNNPLSEIFTGGLPTIISSPLIDGYSSTSWYLGDPKRAFLYREHWPVQVFRRSRDTEDGWNRDIVEQIKIREWGTPHCRNHRYIYKNEA